MYSEVVHIMFVELDKKTVQILDSLDSSRTFNQFEIELFAEIDWMIRELIDQMEVEDSEHDGNKLDKNILERYGYFA